jgi:hypothetical protein
MAELIDFEPEPETSTTLRDQRRPGRPEFVDPTLIPLLRGQVQPISNSPSEIVEPGELSAGALSSGEISSGELSSGEISVEPDRRATLSAARGICLGVALGSLIWGSIGVGFWYYFSG